MRLKKAAVVLVAGSAMLLGSSAQAHIPFIEPEAREDAPASLPENERAEMDYSFANPFPLAEDRDFRDMDMNTFAFDGIDSMAINAYLVPGDVDVYEIVPVANAALPFPAILASVLPPACAELVDAYPVVALIGPGLPRDPAVLDLLPFDIDAAPVPQPESGMNGALYAPNPAVDPREIFVEDVVTGLSWFLPDGLTQACLEVPPPDIPFNVCESFENTIVATAQQGMIVGEAYYAAIWDPAGEAQDYTMNLGATDANYVDRPDINAEIECFNLIHGECTPPSEDLPDGYFAEVCEKSTGETGGGSSGCSVRSSHDGSAPVLAAIWLFGVLMLRRRPRRVC